MTHPQQLGQAGPLSEALPDLMDEVVDVLDVASDSAVDCIRRSPVFCRMSDGTLPFAGRAAYLEQHWEGLRVLRQALATPGLLGPYAGQLTPLRTVLATASEQFAGALDRAHATARWRDRHVTMPSMLQFRRRATELQDAGDALGLAAQAYLRLVVASACPVGLSRAEMPEMDAVKDAMSSLVSDEEQLETLSEELSASLLLLMQHGSDVCRGYQERTVDDSCSVTVATIRRALQ
jgi:hypothetical protein